MKNGVYTACEPCKAHPEWPPLWQVRAKEITEDQSTHTVYFRDAYFDAFGVPVAYIPFFSAADPTVTRKSGFLAPDLRQQQLSRARRHDALFLRAGAELRSHAQPKLLHDAGAVHGRRMAPSHRERRL